MEYVILDIETTGFSPKRGDRIIELGALVVNENGMVVDQFESLINPKRDLGATWVHKISSEMIKDAPTFEEVAATLIQLLQGRVVVCHNAKFDLQFINYQLRTILPEMQDLSGICTLYLSKEIFPDLPSYKLQFLAEYFDIQFTDLHSAYEDARVTKELFIVLLDALHANGIKKIDPRGHRIQFPIKAPIIFSKENNSFLRRSDFKPTPPASEDTLQKILKRLPDTNKSTYLPVQSYLNILGEALSDRIITEDEATKLFELAKDYGISNQEVIEIHEEYLRRLIRVYLFDRIISNAEYDDLVTVSNILGIREKLNLIIDLEKSDIKNLQAQETDIEPIQGYSVCFTGQFNSKFNGKQIERSFAEQLALEKGLVVKHSVTKKLDILVVTDSYTQSSKARKAREYGIRIIEEPIFWKIIGLRVE